jgi:hypothetical protein
MKSTAKFILRCYRKINRKIYLATQNTSLKQS